MKRIEVLFLFLLLPLLNFAQVLGIGTQYVDAQGMGNNVQFAANAAIPVLYQKNSLNGFVLSGVDYTGGRSSVAGLNIKPIQATMFVSEWLFDDKPYSLALGCDTGYLFNFNGGENGIVVTPNLYFDYRFFFVKTGYDFNVTQNEQQFFVRVGIGLGMGFVKMFSNMKFM